MQIRSDIVRDTSPLENVPLHDDFIRLVHGVSTLNKIRRLQF